MVSNIQLEEVLSKMANGKKATPTDAVGKDYIDTPNNGELNGTTVNNTERLYATYNENDMMLNKNRYTTCSNVNLNVNITLVKVDTLPENILIKGVESKSNAVKTLITKGRRQHAIGLNIDTRPYTIQGSASLPVSESFKAQDAESLIWQFQDQMNDERLAQLEKLETAYCSNDAKRMKFRQFQAQKANASSEISNMRGQMRQTRGARMSIKDFELFKRNRRYSETGYVIKISMNYKHDINLKGDVNIDPLVSREQGLTSYPANKYQQVAGTSYKLQSNSIVRTITIPFFDDRQLERLKSVLSDSLAPLQDKKQEILDEYGLIFNEDNDGNLVPDARWSGKSDMFDFITLDEIRAMYSEEYKEFGIHESSFEWDDVAIDLE